MPRILVRRENERLLVPAKMQRHRLDGLHRVDETLGPVDLYPHHERLGAGRIAPSFFEPESLSVAVHDQSGDGRRAGERKRVRRDGFAEQVVAWTKGHQPALMVVADA